MFARRLGDVGKDSDLESRRDALDRPYLHMVMGTRALRWGKLLIRARARTHPNASVLIHVNEYIKFVREKDVPRHTAHLISQTTSRCTGWVFDLGFQLRLDECPNQSFLSPTASSGCRSVLFQPCPVIVCSRSTLLGRLEIVCGPGLQSGSCVEPSPVAHGLWWIRRHAHSPANVC